MSSLAATQSYLTLETEMSRDIFKPSLLVLAAHIPLGVLIKLAPPLGYIHSLLLIGLGLFWVKQRQLERVAYLCAYIVSAEVLWRMTFSSLFWELSKYAVALIMGLYVVLWGLRGVALVPLAALLLLLPAMLLTVSQVGLVEARAAIAVTVTAYFSLVATSSFFHPLQITREELKRLLFAMILPAVSVASIALYSTLTAEKIRFINDSNFQLSGGFGPNQVSSILGLASFASFAFFCLEHRSKLWCWLAGLLSLWFLFQAMMTFSRGGVYCGLGATLCLAGWTKEKQIRNKVLFVGLPMLLLAFVVIFPHLDTFTEGKLSKRYEDTQTTHRGELIGEELDLWQENLVFGVGIGQAKSNRATIGGASHSEFSRLLAEHGVFGLISLMMLVIALAINVAKSHEVRERSLILAFAVWTLLFTFTAALRLVAPAFILGLAFARFDLSEGDQEDGDA